jgi:hypothetical protein
MNSFSSKTRYRSTRRVIVSKSCSLGKLAVDDIDDVAALEFAAAEGFALLDRMETEDAANGKGR